MHRTIKHLLSSLAATMALCGQALAQQYSFDQGYIFQQPYVLRISESSAEEMLGAPGVLSFYKKKTGHPEHINQPQVARKGSRLVIAFARKPVLSLKNYKTPSPCDCDGDAQRFIYLGLANQYHLIGVLFEHDSPGLLLVDKDKAQTFFVHE